MRGILSAWVLALATLGAASAQGSLRGKVFALRTIQATTMPRESTSARRPSIPFQGPR